jgi:hypothetical protein
VLLATKAIFNLQEPTANLYGIKITIRGKARFFDVNGIPGVHGRTWAGFDLR